MFKGIIPSKRTASIDFQMVTPLGDINGKENEPNPPFVQIAVPTSTRGPNKHQKTEKTKSKKGSPTVGTVPDQQGEMEQAFDKLLDDLQIPDNLRPKLTGMESSVKAAMLKSSHTMTISQNPFVQSNQPSTPPAHGTVRRVHSGGSISIGSPSPQRLFTDRFHTSGRTLGSAFAETSSPEHPSSATVGRGPAGHATRMSVVDFASSIPILPRPKSRAQGNTVFSENAASSGKATLKGGKGNKDVLHMQIVAALNGTSSLQLDVEVVKKLRLLLRNESASWTQEFLKSGGYSALLTRLNELLEVEWREEQHDDQILHELLRCFKALSTSTIGCFALRSSCPTPFTQLAALLFSDKKPGDVATRQLIVDMLLILFDLYPANSLSATQSGLPAPPTRELWGSTLTPPSPKSSKFAASSQAHLPSTSGSGSGNSSPTATTPTTPTFVAPVHDLVVLPYPHKTTFSLLRALLLTPAPPPAEAPETPVEPHEFIESLHKPRIYKTYLQELSDVCRDYFWVFCHPNNAIWNLRETDEKKVEKPRAPGGMTGGVEFEAMGYLTTHFKLVNAIAKAASDLRLPKDDEHSAYQFHNDMFLSGMERIIAVARKASTTYYPTLHLEIARYINLALQSDFDLPWTLSRLIGPPPTSLSNKPRSTPHSTPTKKGANSTSGHISPTKKSFAGQSLVGSAINSAGANGQVGVPFLPPPRKTEPLKFN